jgi:prephenate dehydrogenase (NADP+)
LFRHPALLEDTIVSAFKRKETRPDDMEFVTCARGWAEAVALGNMEGYQKRFEETADFYRAQFAASTLIGNQMISSISKNATAASAN